jgi:hypothetical protein
MWSKRRSPLGTHRPSISSAMYVLLLPNVIGPDVMVSCVLINYHHRIHQLRPANVARGSVRDEGRSIKILACRLLQVEHIEWFHSS